MWHHHEGMPMPRSFTPKEHRIYLKEVTLRDGPACPLCGKIPKNSYDTTLDHLDNDHRNNSLENLHILCRGCNVGERNRRTAGNPRRLRIDTLSKYFPHRRFSDARGSQLPPVCVADTQIDRGRLKPRSLRGFGRLDEANWIMEPPYRIWLCDTVERDGSILKADAINGGAEYLERKYGQGSPETVRRYLRKATSITGWLDERRDSNGRVEFVFRPGIDIEELKKELRERADASS